MSQRYNWSTCNVYDFGEGQLIDDKLARCMCSWPDVMSFLDKAHQNLPAKGKRGDDKAASRTGSANTVDRTVGLNSPTSRAKPPSASANKRQAAASSFTMSAPLAKQLVKHAFQKAGIRIKTISRQIQYRIKIRRPIDSRV